MNKQRLADADVTALLHQVDRRLAESALRTDTIAGNLAGIGATSYQSSIAELRARIKRLQNLQAPLFIEDGSGVRLWLKRLANLPIRLLSSKQVIHNQELLDTLAMLLAELEQLRRVALYTTQLSATIEQHQHQITQLQAQLATRQIAGITPEWPVSESLPDQTTLG